MLWKFPHPLPETKVSLTPDPRCPAPEVGQLQRQLEVPMTLGAGRLLFVRFPDTQID